MCTARRAVTARRTSFLRAIFIGPRRRRVLQALSGHTLVLSKCMHVRLRLGRVVRLLAERVFKHRAPPSCVLRSPIAAEHTFELENVWPTRTWEESYLHRACTAAHLGQRGPADSNISNVWQARASGGHHRCGNPSVCDSACAPQAVTSPVPSQPTLRRTGFRPDPGASETRV